MGKYLDKIRQHETTQPKALAPSPHTIQPGSSITWQRADRTIQHGVVDFLHVDMDGTTWAFVTLPDGIWAAVNLKFARLIP